MRTKALLLSAALVAAGVATSMAQSNVYSLNIVGYVNVTLNPGYNLISCPLQSSDPNSSINVVLTNINPVPQSSFVSQWNPTSQSYSPAVLSGGDGFWYDQSFSYQVTNPVPPGQGFFYYNGDGVTETATIVGNVLSGTNSITQTAGYNFYGQFLPIVGDITTNSFPVVTYSTLSTWGGSSYNPAIVGVSAADNGTQYPAFYDQSFSTVIVFAPNPGQGFLYFNQGSAAAWTQVFNVQ